jgi:hypothetical protein
VIAFATAMMDPEAYCRYARPGIERAAEPDSEIIALAALGSICRSLNLVIERAARLDGLEALVIVDQSVEIADAGLCSKIRRALADPDVALVGSTGATGVETVAWWDGAVSSGPLVHRYHEHGGGELDAFAWTRPGTPPAEVDTLAGFLLVLSPWAIRELRFDEDLHLGIGFDRDLCRRARAAGRKIVTADVGMILHGSLDLMEDHDLWIEAHIDLARKWDDRAPPRSDDEWRARARRAEAERDAARAASYSARVLLDARVLQLERELEAMTDTLAWRATAPLRWLNQARRRYSSSARRTSSLEITD